ncbi:MAG: hypoxanthine phosphoribosyltransferase [Clostridiales Family XIII bacterium]|jgi:hypoxanthine phosphoribosyltransferase|nr:hypoxanthine phosphoribosyltransferase [Clostridiales Family XIII bacterium]
MAGLPPIKDAGRDRPDAAGYRLGEPLITQAQIQGRAAEIGGLISRDMAGEELLVVGILKGAVMWMSDVVKHISLPAVRIDFMAVSSYGASTQSSGVVRILKDLDCPIEGMNVVVVEDIVDTGTTLSYLRENLLSRRPKSLRICALLDKPARRRADISVDYTGFTVDDVFIVGYGLDVDQLFRNLPYIAPVLDGA